MVRLKRLETLQRKIRQDDAAELGIPTWKLLREAIQAGRTDEALDLLDYYVIENTQIIGPRITPFTEAVVTALARFGEEEMANAMKQAFYSMQRDVLSKVQSAKDRIQRLTEFHRGINSSLTVIEEPDRYVMKCDPCGTGGTIRRAGIDVGVTKKAYPWSWSKAGVPYYCTHCCIMWEVIPTELHGYPFRITFPGERIDDPCVIFVYKKPELIPEEYFARIGKTKTIK